MGLPQVTVPSWPKARELGHSPLHKGVGPGLRPEHAYEVLKTQNFIASRKGWASRNGHLATLRHGVPVH